jgi:hypothetical protein
LRDDYADDDELLGQLETSKLDLQSHFEIHYSPTAADVPSSSIPQPTAGSPQKVDFTSRYKKRASSSSDELAEYFRITSVPEPFDGVDPLQWWYSRRQQFPHLYRLVRKVLCIPGMSLFVMKLVTDSEYHLQVQLSQSSGLGWS